MDFEILVVAEQFLAIERVEAQLVDSIAGVADQLAQKNALVRIKGMGDKVKQLLQLGAELHLLGG